ncbi:MAG: DUF4956 domain-containing protein [Alphaproteobacteria bacterium]|nr:DUF4956 domain-containing protein [Alphaproteobacteria bacterium]
MNELVLALDSGTPLGAAEVFTNLLVTLLLGLAVMGVYRVSVGRRLISPAMQASLVLLAMIAAMVMMVIGNNVARAFSLVGALAIIRFRTRLRSPWDITFVFFSLATGIACGVGATRVAVIGTTVISLSVLALRLLPGFGGGAPSRSIRCDLAAYEKAEDGVRQILDRYTSERWLEEARSLRFGETMSYRYRVRLKDDEQLPEMMRALSESGGVERVVFTEDEERAGIED